MLEGLVAWVLNNYLGKYVENLNTDQLSIAILTGEVELENLPLRRDALRHLGVPVEIRAGHIGKVKLQIPLRSLRSSPWVIVIERLYLVAGPLALDEWDQGAEELANQERKLAALDAIEACWRLEADGTVPGGGTGQTGNTANVGGTYYASSYSSWLSYGTGVITDIVENMQLHVKDVHIRYEDSTSLPGGGACACGFTIESLSAQSCDSSWLPQFTSHRDGSDISYKTIELRNLAVYWDTVCPKGSGLTSKLPPGELAAALSETNASEGHRYLVAPVSACARLQRNRNELPLRSAATPRIVCDLSLDEVPLVFVDWQYEQMVCCFRGLEFLSRVQQNRRRRPSVPIATDPKAWWMYAIGSHIPASRRHLEAAHTWSECLERARQNIQYVEMYTKYLAQPSAALGAEAKRLKDTVEWSRDFSELRALREVAMRRVPYPSTSSPTTTPVTAPTSPVNPPTPPEQPASHGRNVLVRWFPQWWGWYSPSSSDSAPGGEETISAGSATSPTGSRQLEDEILEALADSAKNNTLLRRDVVFGKFNFTLNSGTLELCASNEVGAKGITMLELQFTELVAGVVSRPRSSSHGIELRLGSILLRDRLTAGTLFPVLVGPPGARDQRPGVGNSNIGSGVLMNLPRGQRFRHHNAVKTPGGTTSSEEEGGPLFSLVYEAIGSGIRRLHIRSRPLDVVYQPAAARWLVEFACAPHQRSAARHRLEEMRARTKQQLTDTWGSMLDGHQHQQRTTWDLSFDVSAPQVILVERFCDPSASIAVIDLGTLHLENGFQQQNGHHQPTLFNYYQPQQQQKSLDDEEEDDEAFMTPCSTPPGSEAGDDYSDKINSATGIETVSDSISATLVTALSETSLHQKLYDTYSVELCDIQVLVGRVRDNWRHAHTKGSSSLHVLDRFNIALQVERRIVPIADPMYPSVTLSANLPNLVAHVNEQKITALKTLWRVISDTSLPSPFNAASPAHHEASMNTPPSLSAAQIQTPQSEESPSISTPIQEQQEDGNEPSRLLTVQFTVDQMSLEVQSRGRSVAELQVSGVTAALSRRPCDLSISLTVHGLLLVDALQTFGPDFELLVASHRHVGMDSMSGSLRDSEPTSPTSPGSPDPGATPRQPRATSPVALTRALSAVVSPPPLPPILHAFDSEALISVEFVIVTGTDEPLQLASIQFNNLDIIANQETIVELVGFVRRVSPPSARPPRGPPVPMPPPSMDEVDRARERTTSTSKSEDIDMTMGNSDEGLRSPGEESIKQTTRTELTFDFHRLSVLLLRGTIEDGRSVGRKIATATMCEAKIQATVDSALFVRGSLGGLQVLDLTREGHLHQRIISVGRDPVADESATGFNFNTLGVSDQRYQSRQNKSSVQANINTIPQLFIPFETDADQTAFSFSVRREIHCFEDDIIENNEPEPVDVSIRMASVWYTHSPQFLSELRSCATEFKQYLADVARSIRSAATDVALGLVHARTEALAHSLYMNPRLAGLAAYDIASPRRLRRRSTSSVASEPHTPYTPFGDEDGEESSTFGATDVRLDVVLDSPVLVLPRSSESCHVLVAHLGKITVNNTTDLKDLNRSGSASVDQDHIEDSPCPEQRTYTVEIRDMNICTLDTSGRRNLSSSGHYHNAIPRVDQLYNCEDPTIALPVLHDTLVRLQVTKYEPNPLTQQPSTLLFDDNSNGCRKFTFDASGFTGGCLTITGSVVNDLRVSLTRAQYEQVFDTMQWLGNDETTQQQQQQQTAPTGNSSTNVNSPGLTEIVEEDVVGVSTLSMDPHVRAKLFPSASRRARQAASITSSNSFAALNTADSSFSPMKLIIRFEVASFGVELCASDGGGIIGLSFGDFLLNWNTPRRYETNVKVSLKSLLVEDLLAEKDSLARHMVASRNNNQTIVIPAPCVSRSFPGDLNNIYQQYTKSVHYGSLPDRLNTKKLYGVADITTAPSVTTTGSAGSKNIFRNRSNTAKASSSTPVKDASRGQDLVTVSCEFVDASAPDFDTTYNSLRKSTTVDLGSLDVVVSASSWVPLLEFFSVTSDNNNEEENARKIATSISTEKIGNSSTCVTIRSLTLEAFRASSDKSLARARVTDVCVDSYREETRRKIRGRLGALHIRHSTPGAHVCAAERFVTIGDQALDFSYNSPIVSQPNNEEEIEEDSDAPDSELILEVSPFVYVHTRKFVTELRAFFADFSRPRTPSPTAHSTPNTSSAKRLSSARRRSSRTSVPTPTPSKMSLKLSADACVMLMPVRAGCPDLLVLDVGRLTVSNVFTRAETTNDENTDSKRDNTGPFFDVMTWRLHDVDVYAAEAYSRDITTMNTSKEPTLVFGDCAVVRRGGSLLTEKCLLEVRVDRNLFPTAKHRKNGVADMTTHCRLSTLDATLDVHDYALVRGVLSYNLGEDTEHILPSVSVPETASSPDDLWTLSSLRIELLDVRVRLRPLACINFVRSRLTVDSFSDLSQDVDLVSRQILVTDERERTNNVFTEVLRPARRPAGLVGISDGAVQAEIHSRRRRDKSKFTVLLNNMRLMAIPDWWRSAGLFIFTQHEFQPDEQYLETPQTQHQISQEQLNTEVPYEFKLNITDSEIVVVEDISKLDTNAVILRSTTLLTYRPSVLVSTNVDGDNNLKPLSCSVNHLELFSCRFTGAERDADEDTALSIVDPVTVSADLSATTLDIQLHELTVRVSYRDMLMFAAMLDSITKQTVVCTASDDKNVKRNISTSVTIPEDVSKLCALGFNSTDCATALKACNGRLDDAALWLTQNAVPQNPVETSKNASVLDIRRIETRAACIRFCLIDDCGDVDVPLAEVALSNLCATYDLSTSTNTIALTTSEETVETTQIGRTVTVECTFALDYYNRVLGGWEPFVEQWRCRAEWRPEETISLQTPTRHRFALHADDVLDVNITDALLALARLVHQSWMSENTLPKTTPRNPFVPYSLKNDTGCVLYFATVITEPDEQFRLLDDLVDEEPLHKLHWTTVQPNEIVPFSYGSTRSKQRHKESHKMRAHQLAVRVYGWRTAAPVTVDRVGIYFRHAAADRLAQPPDRVTALRPARLVFDVQLDGSARKLVTVRSALVLINRLPDAVDVKLVERSAVNAVSTAKRSALLSSGETFPIPLIHAHSHIFLRPTDPNDSYSYSQPDVPWSRVTRPGERAHCPLRCKTNRGTSYHVCCEIRRERYPVVTNSLTYALEQHHLHQGHSGAMMAIPGHTVLLLPALLLVNLLPQEMHYVVTSNCADEPPCVVAKGRVLPGRSAAVSTADPDASLDISVHVENFRCTSGITVSSSNASSSVDASTLGTGDYHSRFRLEDTERRRLFLQAKIEPGRGARIRVTVTVSHWIVNRTGLPLVFREDGFGSETAGQFEEHELARMVAPLLFSFPDNETNNALVARVGYRHGGSKNHGAGTPHWCSQFYLKRGVQVRRLKVSHDSGPDTVYVVGIEVRPARGRRRHQYTTIITVSPRNQLHNRSKHSLEFAQACHATTVQDPAAAAARVNAPPGCHVPFHWPRLDKEQLLCVRCTDNSRAIPQTFRLPTSWSGGLRIDSPLSCHVMLRDAMTGTRALFLHAEVVPHGATYCVVFSDAEALPPPLRVDNSSEVAVTFAQQPSHNLHVGMPATVAHAHRSVPYAWDEPAGPTKMVITAPGGVSAAYDVDRIGRSIQLTYENFIYIAFTGTFSTEDDLDHYDEADYSPLVPSSHRSKRPHTAPQIDPVRSQRLVLDVIEGTTNVVLAVKQPGKRSQLWRMTSTGQLQHEGSASNERDRLILDIDATAPQPSAIQHAKLSLRKPVSRRRTTQTWRFTADGRLCCGHRNTCVQAQDGFLGLRPGTPAVLGPTYDIPPHRSSEPSAVPLEQSVGKQRMRPGSGLLAVEVATDGPTRVLRITDMKQREPLAAKALADDEDWQGVAVAHRPQSSSNANRAVEIAESIGGTEIQVIIMLRTGLGISVVGNGRELLYLQLNNIIAETVCGPRSRELNLSVQDAQCDNQLKENAECPVMLHAARARNPTEAMKTHSLPVLEIRAELQPTAGAVVIFKHLIVCVRPVAIHLEETLLLRMYDFLLSAAGDNMDEDEDNETGLEDADGDDEESVTGAATLGAPTNSGTTTRYHFGIIRLVPGAVRLSVHTASGGALSARLRTLKGRLGLTLVGFEDAPVELEPYVRHHPFETGAHLRRSVFSHFRDELMWQAAAILGSVDFLGSPLGLLGDVTEGVSGLIRERSVGALVLNVAHGLSNSAAKVTETLGDGLGRVAMDDAHEEMRQRIRKKHAMSGGDHLVAGIKGFGFGLLGGATGIFKQVYEGAATDGLQGVFSGLGKGLVGAVAKPVVGVLDLATETARAVRDSSRGTSRTVPERRRQPRASIGPGGLLPPYNPRDSRGQAYLRILGSSKPTSSISSSSMDRDFDGGGVNSGLEQFVAYECVRSGEEDLRVIVSSERVRVVTGANSSNSSDSLTIVTETGLGELVCCVPVTQDRRHYIEMTVRGGSGSAALRRPCIRCDTEELARAVTRQVNYAKRLHEEAAHTLHSQDD